VDRWHAGKARDLFQYLLLNRGHVIRRERLFDTLWPDSEWSPTTSSLKVAVHSLRRILDDVPGAGSPRPVEIISRDRGYLLYANHVRLDIDEFDAGMAAGRVAEERGEGTMALTAYRRAVEFYTGDFLAAQTADWIGEQRQFYRSAALYALARLRADALRRHAHSEIIRLCQRTLDIDPSHEEAYQTLILVHGRRGELGQAREWHQLCVRRLQRDLDVSPTEVTQQIFARAVRGELRVATGPLTDTAPADARREPRPRTEPSVRGELVGTGVGTL
jgi:two-component SAPR family response regulator